MLYLFGVYGLVVIAVSLPILLLYIAAGLASLVLRAIRLLITRVRGAMSPRYPGRTADWVNVAKIPDTRKAA